MTATTMRARPSTAARRFGYCVTAVINAVLLYLLHGRPGWSAVPFLTASAADVVPWITASLIAGLAVSLVQVIRDPAWLIALGGMVTTAIGAAAMARLWQVFPFDFGEATFDWALIARFVLGIGLVGSVIAFVTNTVKLIAARHGGATISSPRQG